MSVLNRPNRAVVTPLDPGAGGHAPTFEQAASVVLGNLQTALAELLAAAPGPTHRATDVEQTFGVDYRLAWQVFRIATSKNTLAAGTNVPARVSMNKLLKSAARRRVPAGVIAKVADAFEQFERFVQSDAGDREALGSMLGALVPEEGEKHELAAKEGAFKAMSQIVGVAMDADISATIRHPSKDGRGVDIATLQGHLGLRRLRPGAPIVFVSGDVNPVATTPFTLEGEVASGPGSPLLAQFCSSPLARFDKREIGGISHYSVAGKDVGLRSAIDLVMADWREGTLARYHEPGGKTHASVATFLDCPAKRMTVDHYVHRDLYDGVHPELAIYDLGSAGIVTNFNDPAREHHRLHMHESVRPIGTGLGNTRVANAPRYTEILEFVFAKLGWNPDEFRAYRLDVHYPVYGLEYMTGFRMPDAPRRG